jgi:hypothetical protein
MTEFHRNGHEPNGLRAALEAAGGSLKSLTVLAPQNDPFRRDTPTGHAQGHWLADQIATLKLTGPRHLRGLHYALLGRRKPDGQPYTNTDEDWTWLQGSVAKSARFLGYVPFDQIVDERNDEPETRLADVRQEGRPFLSVGADVSLPDAEDLKPYVGLGGFTAIQPYRLVLVGEKSSLRPVLGRVAGLFDADLYLPNGEISDTQIHTMASRAANMDRWGIDGRPTIVFYFADCDPAGWQMPISVARKLQAFKAIGYDFEFQVHRVGLKPRHVREYNLPSTPLKPTEKRAGDWLELMGVEQTEIDALAALQPGLLDQMARDAIAPFFDDTLARRVSRAERDWLTAARQAVEEQTDVDLGPLREQAATQLAEKEAEIQAILDTIQVDADMFDLPQVPEVPEPELDGDQPEPLCDSAWDFAEQCRRLIKSKQYTDGEMGA